MSVSIWSKAPEEECSLNDGKLSEEINSNISNSKFITAYKLLKQNFKDSEEQSKSCYYKKRNKELKDLVKKQLENSKKKIEQFMKTKDYKSISAELIELINQGAESLNETFITDFLNKYQTPEVCKAGLYQICYNGVRWGTKVDYSISEKLGCIKKTETVNNSINLRLFRSEEEESRENLLSKINTTQHNIILPSNGGERNQAENINDDYIKSLTDGSPLMSTSRNLIDSGSSCSAIILDDRLVGVYGYVPFSSTKEEDKKDEYLYVKANMKKTYGKNVEEKPFSFAQWENTNGMNVLLVMRTYATSMYFRCLNIDAINDVKRQLIETAKTTVDKLKI
jgi:hypothetical protein